MRLELAVAAIAGAATGYAAAASGDLTLLPIGLAGIAAAFLTLPPEGRQDGR